MTLKLQACIQSRSTCTSANTPRHVVTGCHVLRLAQDHTVSQNIFRGSFWHMQQHRAGQLSVVAGVKAKFHPLFFEHRVAGVWHLLGVSLGGLLCRGAAPDSVESVSSMERDSTLPPFCLKVRYHDNASCSAKTPLAPPFAQHEAAISYPPAF